jgi:hypothetical protein
LECRRCDAFPSCVLLDLRVFGGGSGMVGDVVYAVEGTLT